MLRLLALVHPPPLITAGFLQLERLYFVSDQAHFGFQVSHILPVMQAGFAMLESGCCRSKNLTNILLKVEIFPSFVLSSHPRQNMLDTCVGAVWWWLVGFAFAFGDETSNPFIGNKYFALTDVPRHVAQRFN